jgi:23S rRNA (pseudouridine1915-N3)-methyltransferase
MEVEFRTLHFGKTSWAHPVSIEYIKKISFFVKSSLKTIKNESDFLKNISEKDFLIVCDEQGKNYSSKEFAVKFNAILETGKQKCIIVIGGPFGVPLEVKSRANLVLRLSDFVFNQEVALVVLLEQVFRALTIINNHPYHNE